MWNFPPALQAWTAIKNRTQSFFNYFLVNLKTNFDIKIETLKNQLGPGLVFRAFKKDRDDNPEIPA